MWEKDVRESGINNCRERVRSSDEWRQTASAAVRLRMLEREGTFLRTF